MHRRSGLQKMNTDTFPIAEALDEPVEMPVGASGRPASLEEKTAAGLLSLIGPRDNRFLCIDDFPGRRDQ